MALITKVHRCAFCGSSEVVVSENGTYTCKDCGKVADHGMPAADVEAINRIMMTGGDAETAEELRRRYPRLDLTTWSKENRLQFCFAAESGYGLPPSPLKIPGSACCPSFPWGFSYPKHNKQPRLGMRGCLLFRS